MLECGLDGERLRPITLGNTSLKCKALTASWVAQLVKNPPAVQETLVQFLGREVPLAKDRLPTPVFSGFSGGSDVKSSPTMRPGFNPWVGKIP